MADAVFNQNAYDFTEWALAAALGTDDPTYDGVKAVTAQRQNYLAMRTLPGARAASVATIYDNALTLQGSAFIKVDTENGAPADELETIIPTFLHDNVLQLPLCPDGALIYLQAANTDRQILVKHGVGKNQIALYDSKDVYLSTRWWLSLQLEDGIWRERRIVEPFDPSEIIKSIADLKTLITTDPLSVFPKNLPVIFSGIKFNAGSRNPIFPGETTPRPDWFICDGGSDGKGGTVPNLTNAFPWGVGVAGEVWGRGGNVNHTHSIGRTTTDGATIGSSQTGTHTHGIGKGQVVVGGSGIYVTYTLPAADWSVASTANSSGGSGSHSHGMAGTTGSGGSYPPYVYVQWIVRV